MAKINLLPWRAELKKQRQKEFLTQLVLAMLLAGVVIFAVHLHYDGAIEYQRARNENVKREIAEVDKKIKEINAIEDKKHRLLTKIDVIQKLQESRPEAVHLFDEIPKLTPEGVFLSSFKQSGRNLTFEGKTESNARVSAFMRAVESSDWLSAPSLNIIQSKDKTAVDELSDFTLQAKLGHHQDQEAAP